MSPKSAAATAEAKSVGQMIDVTQLFPSATNPRKRFPENSIAELAGSIKEKGIIEPLIVREKNADGKSKFSAYEIVCGERRYRAGQKASLRQFPCIVRDLTDEEVLDIQIHENLHREDVHPMDEAVGYKFLQEKLSCDIKELAVRVSKTESYVLSRLKLNSLIKEVQDDLDAGHLPLTYALEIAKYPAESQKSILAIVFDTSQYHDQALRKWVTPKRGEKVIAFKSLLDWVNNNILYQLNAAIFDLKSTALRKDGLACVNCPDRTGANAGLFDTGPKGKKDSCLNPTCYNGKRLEHIHVLRSKLAHEDSVDIDAIPIVDSREWNSDPKFEINGRTVRVIGMNDAVLVKPPKGGSYRYNTSEKACQKMVSAIDVARDYFGKVVTVCLRSSDCKDHWKKATASTKSAKPQSEKAMTAAREKELDEKRQRREAIWNCGVAEIVRKRVFALAAPKFAKQFKVTGGGANFLPALLAQMRVLFGYNNHVQRTAETIMEAAMDVKGLGLDSGDREAKFAKWPEQRQKELLFLYIHGHKGDVAGSYWRTQKEVLDIAKQWDINYALIDAQVRVEQSTKKMLEAHKAYLVAVEAGKKAEIPWCFSPNWKRND